MSHTLKIVMFVATLALLPMLASGQKVKKTAVPANGPFSGVWDTRSAGHMFTVRLTQTGKNVTGTYTPYNGKIFDGVVAGNKLTFKWTQDGGYEGTGEFTLDADRKGFTGSSTVIKPEPQTNSWNTYKPAPPESFAGTWDLVNNIGVRIPLTIVQHGSQATGLYPSQNGKLEGTIDGRILRFKWESNKGSGSGEFNISNSGETFGVISFKKGNGTDVAESGTWGERTSGGKKSIDGDDNGIDDTTKGGTGGKIMASYGGSWLINEGGAQGGMDVGQSGPGVTGTYATGRGAYRLIGAVNGSFLRFTLVPLNAPPGEKTGEIRMEPDGKSFKGTVGGISVSGTLRP